MTPDKDPVIDRHPLYSNIIIAAGFSGRYIVYNLRAKKQSGIINPKLSVGNCPYVYTLV